MLFIYKQKALIDLKLFVRVLKKIEMINDSVILFVLKALLLNNAVCDKASIVKGTKTHILVHYGN